LRAGKSSVGEILGYKRSLQNSPKDAPWFYILYTIVLIFGAMLVGSDINLVRISVGVEVMNAICLPIVLIFLFLLARKALPPKYRLKGWYSVLVFIVLAVTTLFGFVGGILGSF